MTWMQTYTGRKFYPLSPSPEDVDLVDIAHALSMICRYGGHVCEFYSVAEHSWLMSYAVPPEHALTALLHDAAEAYVGDMVRPLKRQLARYMSAERVVLRAIEERFGIDGLVSLPAAVKEADNRILLTERDALLTPAPDTWDIEGLTPLPVTIGAFHPRVAKRVFLERFDELTGGAS